MHVEIFGFNGNALGSVSNLALLLIIASLVIALLVRLGIAIFATERAKEHKQAPPQLIDARKWPIRVVPLQSPASNKSAPSPQLLSTSVMRYLDKVEVCNPVPKNERAEDQTIRSQKDMAAEIFRSARMERIRQNGWHA